MLPVAININSWIFYRFIHIITEWRTLYFVGSTHKDLREFPDIARREAGYQLSRVQAGFGPKDWKPMKTVGPGVREFPIHAEGEFRVIYVTNIGDVAYVLHAFRKKTQTTSKAGRKGTATVRPDTRIAI